MQIAMTGKPVVYLIRTSVIKKERFISFRADDLNGRFCNVYFLIIARRANMRMKLHFRCIFFLLFLISKYNLILMFGVLPRFRFIYGFYFSYFYLFIFILPFLKFNLLASFIARETTRKKMMYIYIYLKKIIPRSQKI